MCVTTTFVYNRFSQTETALRLFPWIHKKRTKELPMTVPELKSTVYLLPEIAWPIIKQTVGNTGNRLQCSEVPSHKGSPSAQVCFR